MPTAQPAVGPAGVVQPTDRRSSRILLVNPVSEASGSSASLLTLVRGLHADGRFEPQVALGEVGWLAERLREVGVPVHWIRHPRLSSVRGPGYNLAYLAAFPTGAVSFSYLCRRLGVRLVFLNTSVSPFAVIGARLAGVPVVVHTREIPTRRLVRWALSTFNARLATVVTANSRFTAAKVARRGPPPRVIYNGFEYPPDPPNPPASGCILAVARMSPDKGPDLVLKAFARILEALPEARLAVAGGPLPGHENFWRRIQELAAASGFRGRVTLHGWCENLAPLFRTNDVLLHLPHFEEPFGRAIVEAAGFGLPCVTFACGGIPEIVEDAVTGYLVAHRDVEAAAARCVHLLESPGLTARLGAAARKNAIERFPVERYIREMSDVFGALIHQMRQPSAARPPSPQE